MSMNAAGAMTRNVICIRPDTPLDEAHSIMTGWNIRHLPVVEGKRLLGILSDRDVMIRANPSGEGVFRVPGTPASRAMTVHPVTCRPSSSVSYVAGLMLEYKIDSVPVVGPAGDLVGLVTSADLLQLMRDADDTEQALPFQFTIETNLHALRVP